MAFMLGALILCSVACMLEICLFSCSKAFLTSPESISFNQTHTVYLQANQCLKQLDAHLNNGIQKSKTTWIFLYKYLLVLLV